MQPSDQIIDRPMAAAKDAAQVGNEDGPNFESKAGMVAAMAAPLVSPDDK